jgi:hypothetical protein
MKKLNIQFLTAMMTFGMHTNNAQTLNIHSIDDSRMWAGDYGYTLNGMHMIYGAAVKLSDTSNFSPAGTYPKNVTITSAYATSGSLENISGVQDIDLFYFGSFDKNNFWLYQFTDAELDSLYNWSVNGGKMIIGGAAAATQFGFQTDILDSKWNFEIALASLTSIYPTTAGTASTIFNGPFGTITSASQGGNYQGYFSSIPADAVVLADDGAGNPTLILDCKTLDLIMSDADGFNDLGGVTYGPGMYTDNDKFWTNAVAYMDQLQGPPVISQTSDTLYSGAYSSYQWYLNGVAIPGATSNSYIASQSGVYSVEVALDCGCSNISSRQVYVTVGLDEIFQSSNISMGPNPVENGLLNFFGIDEPVNVSIVNSVGIIAESSYLDIYNTSVNTGKLASGIYSVCIENKKGTKLAVKKLIKR